MKTKKIKAAFIQVGDSIFSKIKDKGKTYKYIHKIKSIRYLGNNAISFNYEDGGLSIQDARRNLNKIIQP